ncbi:SIS domain-containing protein, partial [Lachnospiraceae bacterium OttesenSCG-928-E19]|nr:SIS domain-containing protein [Lachnospiraceae bacterium OttesenSCG-928-E19]
MIYHGDALEYIYETPKILKQILIHQEEILQDKDKLCATKIGEVILTGSGSSYNAAVCATAFARKLLGIRVSAVYPVSLVEELETISEHALILGISQQGTSTAVIRALDMANENGISTVAVTGEHNTEIIKHADACLYVECGYEDAGATTKGFTATVMTLMLFFITLGIDMNRISVEEAKLYRERLEDVVNNTSIVLEESLP